MRFDGYGMISFRLCKEPNHIPLRCDEVEKGLELEMRKFIEEHVTEAMIRKCPRCTQVSFRSPPSPSLLISFF